MFLTLVPCFKGARAPLTFKSLMTITVSPSFKILPLASLILLSSLASLSFHYSPHIGQTYILPSR